MSEETESDGYTLGLLVDLRDVCRKIGDDHYRMAAELHDLLRRVAHPDVHGLDAELTFRIEQGEYGETLRTISLSGKRRGGPSRVRGGGEVLSARAVAAALARSRGGEV